MREWFGKNLVCRHRIDSKIWDSFWFDTSQHTSIHYILPNSITEVCYSRCSDKTFNLNGNLLVALFCRDYSTFGFQIDEYALCSNPKYIVLIRNGPTISYQSGFYSIVIKIFCWHFVLFHLHLFG